MKISIGADHAGYQLKEHLREKLAAEGHEVVDRGTTSSESTDYPDYALAVGRDVASGQADRGILVCFTGIGMAIAANKVDGVRAAPAYNLDEVGLTRRHNDTNVLTIGAKYTPEKDAEQFVETFLNEPFEGGRHERRVNKITAAERSNHGGSSK